MSTALRVDPVATIKDALTYFQTFDNRAKEVILAFQKDESKLKACQAEKVITFAATQFGKEAALTTFNLLKKSLMDTEDNRYQYPTHQIDLLKSLTQISSDKMDFATVFTILKKLKFYDEGNYFPGRKHFEESPLGTSSDQSIQLTVEIALEPIKILGNQYGEEEAIHAVKEARWHRFMELDSSFKEGIRSYFKSKFGNMSVTKIEPELTYSSIQSVLDFFRDKNPDNNIPSGRQLMLYR